eukprot:m51a1_g4505 hypothetical protein (238) ;mRNA; r:380878-381863
MAPPRVWASSSKVYFLSPFQVTFEAGLAWMAEHHITEELVRDQAGRAKLLLAGSGHRREDEASELPPCQRCCSARGANVTLGFSTAYFSSHAADSAATGTCVVHFDDCRSHCNSSRLHLGGCVVIEFEVVDSLGHVVARPRTQPLMLCSKPTHRTSPLERTPERRGVADDSPAGPARLGPAAPQSQGAQWAAGSEASVAQKLEELETTLYHQLLYVRFAKMLFGCERAGTPPDTINL